MLQIKNEYEIKSVILTPAMLAGVEPWETVSDVIDIVYADDADSAICKAISNLLTNSIYDSDKSMILYYDTKGTLTGGETNFTAHLVEYPDWEEVWWAFTSEERHEIRCQLKQKYGVSEIWLRNVIHDIAEFYGKENAPYTKKNFLYAVL